MYIVSIRSVSVHVHTILLYFTGHMYFSQYIQHNASVFPGQIDPQPIRFTEAACAKVRPGAVAVHISVRRPCGPGNMHLGKMRIPGALNAIIEFPENFCPLCIVHFPFSFSPAAALSGRGSRILSFVHWEGIERLPAPERRPFRHRPEKHAYPATAQRSILHHMRFFVMPKYVTAVPGGHVKKRNRQRRDPLKPLFLCLRIRKKQPSLSRRLFSGRGRRTRTLKNGFGDRYVTITSCPCMRFSNCFAIVPNRAKKSKPFSARSGKKYITRTGSDTGAGSNRRFFPSPPVKILPAAAARTAAGSLSCPPVPGDRCPCRQNRSRSSSSLCLPR